MKTPDEADYDDIIGKCDRKVSRGDANVWCWTHESHFPWSQARCNSRLDEEDTVERLLERVKCDEGDECYTCGVGLCNCTHYEEQ